jgi:hypothetical protein
MLVGLYILYRAFQSMRKPALADGLAEEPSASTQDDYLQRVEEELKKRN